MIIIFFLTILTFIAVPLDSVLKRKIYYAFFGGAILIGIIILLAALNGKELLTSTQTQRFNFLKPCQRYMEAGTGYQVCNGYIAINNGGLFGVGIGNSTQKYLYLPEAHTDFIFPVIIEELGLVTGILIILAYAFIIYRILVIARKSSNLMGSIICYGVAMYIFMHIFVNFVGILGLLPLTGVPLPFLSYGGCYAICITLAITMVERINIDTYNYRQEENIRNKIKGR
jgi:cell division protein FtsW